MKRIIGVVLSACLLFGAFVSPIISASGDDGAVSEIYIDSDYENLTIIENISEGADIAEEMEADEALETDADSEYESSAITEDITEGADTDIVEQADTAEEAEDVDISEAVEETESESSGADEDAAESEDDANDAEEAEAQKAPESETDTDDEKTSEDGEISEEKDDLETVDDITDEKDSEENFEDITKETDGEEEIEEREESEEESEEEPEELEEEEELEEKPEEDAEITEVYIKLDSERNVTVTAIEEIYYEITDEFGQGDIIVTLKPDSETNLSKENIYVSLPDRWNWMYDDTNDGYYENEISKEIVIILYEASFLQITRLAAGGYFTQDEINDDRLWYAEADFEITLAETPTTTVYTRLRTAIQNATPNAVTHIIIPFHINTGSITLNGSLARVPNGATVVLIGDHPTAENGQVVISDTNVDTNVSRIFRVRGNNTERCALVLRNIILQNSAPSALQAIPDTPPAPLELSAQTDGRRGGGVTIESADGGGGHFILCRDGELRNNSTDLNGTVDVQSGRFTMMPGSLIHNNVAGNSGGGVNVNGQSAVFNMYGGAIRDNLARGENAAVSVVNMRASGGGVLVQNRGTFNMYDGEITNNTARLGEIAPAPTAANAMVTSCGGGVFVTGAGSSFTMYGGSISGNSAIRTRSPNVVATNRHPLRAGSGGGVHINDRGSFVMHGGYIQDNLATATNVPVAGDNEAYNLSNGGGVHIGGAGTTFHMLGGTIRNNRAIRVVNSAVPVGVNLTIFFAGNGGGVHIFNNAVFTMDDGEIYGNIATATGSTPVQRDNNLVVLSNGGGVFVGGTGIVGDTESGRFIMNGGTIRNNHAMGTVSNDSSISGNGGGVCAMTLGSFVMTGGEIFGNSATDDNQTIQPREAMRRGNGAGVFIRMPGTTLGFDMSGGTIRDHNNLARNGAGVFMSNGRAEVRGTALIENNHSPIHGGGIYLDGNATLNMNGGTINGNTALNDGGGIFVSSTNNTVNMQSGSITNNTANDGGGMFIPHLNLHTNLSRITIASNAVFDGNIARNGIRVDNNLAANTNSHIRPDTVSVEWLAESAANPGTYSYADSHVFTNYDINAQGFGLWRVTYGVGSGEDTDSVTAQIGTNNFPVENGSFVTDGAKITFIATPAISLQWWNIGLRENELNEDGSEAEFEYTRNNSGTPFEYTISAHTNVLGIFLYRPDIPMTGLNMGAVTHILLLPMLLALPCLLLPTIRKIKYKRGH